MGVEEIAEALRLELRQAEPSTMGWLGAWGWLSGPWS